MKLKKLISLLLALLWIGGAAQAITLNKEMNAAAIWARRMFGCRTGMRRCLVIWPGGVDREEMMKLKKLISLLLALLCIGSAAQAITLNKEMSAAI